MSLTQTGISWTHLFGENSGASWNFLRGCSPCSPGCKNCYAMHLAANRLSGPGQPYEGLAYVDEAKGPQWTGKVAFIEEKLLEPIRRQKRTGFFVNSMSDWAHESVKREWQDKMFAVMAICHLLGRGHVFQGLTKRADLAAQYLNHYDTRENVEREASLLIHGPLRNVVPKAERSRLMGREIAGKHLFDVWPLPNFWHGVSVENQHFADKRIPILRQTTAAVRWLSLEPLLGHIDLTGKLLVCGRCGEFYPKETFEGDGERWTNFGPLMGLGHKCYEESLAPAWADAKRAFDWAVIGGESGSEARDCYLSDIRILVEQLQHAEIACFVKQLGARPIGIPTASGDRLKLKDRKGGEMSEWPEDLRVREYPTIN